MPEKAITDAEYWDSYWANQWDRLPVEVDRHATSLQQMAILDLLDRYLPQGSGGAVVELGGSPGRYLAYVHRRTGCDCTIVDNSPEGCALARENFRRLGIPLAVHESDILDPGLKIGTFDVVYSLGLIEHFSDLSAVVAAHVRLVRPGGLLVLGIPNFRGVNGWLAARLCPRRLATHNLEAMRLATWEEFERSHRLERLFLAPIGGFEPGVFAFYEKPLPARYLPLKVLSEVLLRSLTDHISVLRRINHPLISGYLMGIWHVPESYRA